MNEKLKGFLSKDNPSDEELELFLFAMNQQVTGKQALLRNIVKEIGSAVEGMNIFILPRLRSQCTLSDGLRDEMANAMTTMRDLGFALGLLQEECQEGYMRQLARYVGADNEKHFKKKIDDQQS